MRIGIDATALPAELYGAGNYIVQLAHALPRVDSSNAYIFFVKSSQSALFDPTCAEVVPILVGSRISRIAWEQMQLPALARQHRLDVLHSPHYTMPLTKPCPSVVTLHDMTFSLYPELHLWYKRLFFNSMIPLAVRRADALIAVSASTRADTIRLLHAAPEKIFSIPYGIDPAFHPIAAAATLSGTRAKYHLPEKFVLYVGNLEPRKNLPALVRAFASIAASHRDTKLVLAGSRGWKDAPVFAAVNKLGLTDVVLFPGFIPQADLPAVYSLARAFVYPSLYEGFGLPVLEAMACGLPVITSNLSSLPEIVEDAGILIDPRSERELADALRQILTDGALHERLASRGLKRAAKFSWERTARETLAVYQRAAQAR